MEILSAEVNGTKTKSLRGSYYSFS